MAENDGLHSRSVKPEVFLWSSVIVHMQDLQFVIAVADTKSFRGAAEVLKIAPSAVSRRMRELEDRVGGSLFERQNSGTRLTTAGQQFLAGVRPALLQIDRAARSVRDAGTGSNGSIKVGVIGPLSSPQLSRLVTEFRSTHVGIEVEIIEGTSRGLEQWVESRVIDVAFVLNTSEKRRSERAEM